MEKLNNCDLRLFVS